MTYALCVCTWAIHDSNRKWDATSCWLVSSHREKSLSATYTGLHVSCNQLPGTLWCNSEHDIQNTSTSWNQFPNDGTLDCCTNVQDISFSMFHSILFQTSVQHALVMEKSKIQLCLDIFRDLWLSVTTVAVRQSARSFFSVCQAWMTSWDKEHLTCTSATMILFAWWVGGHPDLSGTRWYHWTCTCSRTLYCLIHCKRNEYFLNKK